MAGGSGNASRNFGRLPMSRYIGTHIGPAGPKCQCNDHLPWLVGLFATSAVRSGGWSGLDFTAKPRAQPMKNEAGGSSKPDRKSEAAAPCSVPCEPV